MSKPYGTFVDKHVLPTTTIPKVDGGDNMLEFPMADNPNPYEMAAARRYGMPLALRRSGQILQGYAWFGALYVSEEKNENNDREQGSLSG